MPLRTDDRKSSGFLDFRGKLDVGSSSGHVGGDGHGRSLACLGHDLGLAGMLLGIQHIVTDSPEPEHFAEEFGSLHIRSAYKDRPSLPGQFHDPVDHCVVFGPLRLVNHILPVVTDYRTVGRDHDDVELVYGPEFAGLRLCRTGHTGELVVHPEIVLQGDGGKRLCGGLHLHVFLGLHRLVQTVAPTASFHHTSGLFVDNLHLVVHDDVVDILLEHGISLQELRDSMHALALQGEILHQGILLLLLFSKGKPALFDGGDLASHVREHEEVGIGNITGHEVGTLVGHRNRILLFLDDEIEGVGDHMHLPLVVLHIEILGFLHYLLHAGLAEELDERLIFWKSLMGPEKKLSAFILVSSGNSFLGFVKHLVHKCSLALVKSLDIGTELHELGIVLRLGDGSGDDERGPGIVNEDGVYLVDDGIMVLPLDKVVHIHGHVVAEIVETELVVGAEGYVAVIRILARIGVGLVLIDAVDGKPMEHVQGTHPF